MMIEESLDRAFLVSVRGEKVNPDYIVHSQFIQKYYGLGDGYLAFVFIEYLYHASFGV